MQCSQARIFAILFLGVERNKGHLRYRRESLRGTSSCLKILEGLPGGKKDALASDNEKNG